MAIAQRRTSLPGSPDPGRPRRAPHRITVAVLAIGLGITIALALTTFRAHQRNERKLLALQTRLVSAAVAAGDGLYVEDHLGGAASLAAATNGDGPTFRKAVSDSVTARGPFDLASLWRLGAGPPQLVTAVGAVPLLAPTSPRAAALFRQAAASKTFLVIKVASSHAVGLGYADAATGSRGSFVVYAEVPLPVNHRAPESAGSPFSQLNLAIYLGRAQTSSALLEANSGSPLPLRGTTFTTTIPFGNTVLTLTASPRTSLTGATGVILPPAIALGGLLLTVLVALLAERLVRRRVGAERLTHEVGRLYVEQRSVAETLQHALLPQDLPSIPGMEIAVRYLPGASGVDIGGDWYDVVPLDDDRFVFVVGDVSGRGVRAAAVMASLHYASRAYALEGHRPAAILDRLTRTLSIERDGHFATVLCGLVDVATHEVMLANAGHLPPLMCSDTNCTFVTTSPGAPIGISSRTVFEQAMVRTAAQDTLIAYTDGLIERRGEILDVGLKRLQEAATRESASLADLLDSIITELTGDSPSDDIALIGLRWLN